MALAYKNVSFGPSSVYKKLYKLVSKIEKLEEFIRKSELSDSLKRWEGQSTVGLDSHVAATDQRCSIWTGSGLQLVPAPLVNSHDRVGAGGTGVYDVGLVQLLHLPDGRTESQVHIALDPQSPDS